MNKILMWLLLGLGLLPLFSACGKEAVEEDELESHITGNMDSIYYANLIESPDTDALSEIECKGYVVHVPAEGGSFRFMLSPQAERVITKYSTHVQTREPLSSFQFRLSSYCVGKWDSGVVPEAIKTFNFKEERGGTILLGDAIKDSSQSISNDYFSYSVDSRLSEFKIEFAPNEASYELGFHFEFGTICVPFITPVRLLVIQGAKK